MKPRSWSLQSVALAPVLIATLVTGAVLYFSVLKTVGEFADQSIRENLGSTARAAFEVADTELDLQHATGRGGASDSSVLHQLNARMRFEVFAREHDVGLIVASNGVFDFASPFKREAAIALMEAAPRVGAERAHIAAGEEVYIRVIDFSPWKWRIFLVKDAAEFEALLTDVQHAYVACVVVIAVVALFYWLWMRRALVQPIFSISDRFAAGHEPESVGIRELDYLASNISNMMTSLQNTSLHLQTTLQNMSDGIAVVDADMKLVAWNQQFMDLYRYPPDSLYIGLPFADLMRMVVEREGLEGNAADQSVETMIARARALSPPRFEVERPDGQAIEVRRAPMPDGGFVTTYSDITDRKRAERQVVARRAAEQANATKSKFLENIGHDLLKPTKAVIEFSSQVLRSPGAALESSQRRFLEHVVTCAEHSRDMLVTLLEIAKAEAGQVKVRAEVVDVTLMLERCVAMVLPGVDTHRVDVVSHLDTPLRVTTDPHLLNRIIMNLADNAARYTHDGRIELSAHLEDGELVVDVTDTGIGMEANATTRYFQKFERAENTSGHTAAGTGLGLGLSICREFVDLLGGTINVTSRIGEGSAFTVRLPIVPPPSAP